MAIEAHQALLVLEPLDLAETHFRLARLLKDEGQLAKPAGTCWSRWSKRRATWRAHRLLLEIAAEREKH